MPKTNETKIKAFKQYIEYKELFNKIRMHGGFHYDYMLAVIQEEINLLEDQFAEDSEAETEDGK
jgi:hypothetical protein